MFKVTILVLFLCCHLHLSYAKTDVGKKVVKTGILSSIFGGAKKATDKVGDKVVKTGILSSIFGGGKKATEKVGDKIGNKVVKTGILSSIFGGGKKATEKVGDKIGTKAGNTGILYSIFGGATKAAEKAGDKIGSKTVHTGILTGISTAATKAAEKAARPFYKFFIEGGTGFVTRYFTLNDYFGIGKTIRKGLVATASSVGSGAWSVGKVVKKFADKKMQDQAEEMAEEMNKWWMKQKDAAMDSIKSGIKGGITAVASAAIGGKWVDKINDKKLFSADSSSGNVDGGSGNGDGGNEDGGNGNGGSGNGGNGDGDGGNGDGGNGDSGNGDGGNGVGGNGVGGNGNGNGGNSDGGNGNGDGGNGGGSGSAFTGGVTSGGDDNPFGVSISDKFYAKPWGIPGSGGADSSSSIFNIWGKPIRPVMGSDSSVSHSQVVIGKPVGEQTGEADSSSTVTIFKNAFKWMSGASGSEDDSSGSGGSGGSASGSLFDIFGTSGSESTDIEPASDDSPGASWSSYTTSGSSGSGGSALASSMLDIFGASGSEDESSGSDNGCNRRCRKEKARKRSNKRKSRSVDGEGVDPLVAVFENIAREDPQQCLPLLICAIHADPQGLLTPQETKLVTVFRPLVIHRHVPEWAGPWVRGARQGVSVSHEKVEVGNTTCRKEFPNCPFSAHYLRSQMSETYDVTPQKDELRKDIHLELNMIES